MKEILILTVLASAFFANIVYAQSSSEGWKAGVAKVIITPQQNLWMAGYGARDHPAEGKLHDLWAKALVIEDASGQRAVLISTDLLGVPKKLSDRIRDRLNEKLNLTRAQILLNSSHTHSGPVLEESLSDIYPLNEAQLNEVAGYSAVLEDQIVHLVSEAFASLEPVKIFTGNGTSRFQVNRRNNNAATLHMQTDLNGPNDYAVPVMKVQKEGGEMMAIAFGYACHPTVLSFYQWSGDYPGFAQMELEKRYPDATALFFQGAGADQNPLPRRTVALAKQYGQTLAAAVVRVLSEEMKELAPHLTTAYTEIALSLDSPPTKETLTKMIDESSSYQKRWAQKMLSKLEHDEAFESSYPYPLQILKLGDQPIFSLGGELVVEYSILLKQIFGHEIFVLGYSNDVMAYIPSTTILREGGYEGASSQIVYGLPSTWSPDIESNIINGMIELAKQAGVKKVESKLINE
ncbi:neutral ceramidase [Catalinimonas alkaloidigena]|uniref:neutral/alkaline non-lysosomal ceramidase N-terminal domain-containing protein n=1 Tax=Catalinimonas alkaloidigena TaxID=1075417 RepID=UPI002404B4D0|nr:neutral/alkaline non-lysosomal ceramidase N-terminal domain-containing protein [Catalinimonas alkaloidigena]MDF9798894.1 neutral ceramidase [Catalinimonas alkaloidigena]